MTIKYIYNMLYPYSVATGSKVVWGNIIGSSFLGLNIS